MEWQHAFADYAALHPEIGAATGPITYLAPDFVKASQVGEHAVLVWNGEEVTAHALPVPPARGVPIDPDLGTGQQLFDYLRDWDKPDDQVMVEQGVSRLMVWSVKNALKRGGLTLNHPAPEGSDKGWKTYPAGFPVPPDWLGRGG